MFCPHFWCRYPFPMDTRSAVFCFFYSADIPGGFTTPLYNRGFPRLHYRGTFYLSNALGLFHCCLDLGDRTAVGRRNLRSGSYRRSREQDGHSTVR